MTSCRLAGSVVLAVLAALLAACGVSAEPGAPTAISSAETEPTMQTSESAGTAPGSTPAGAQLDLASVDSCSVISLETLDQLGYEPPALQQDKTSPTKVGCSFQDKIGIDGTALFLDSGQGYEQYSRSSPGNVVTRIDVLGRNAYSVQDQLLGGCTVGVDLAPAQTLSAARTGSQSDPVAPLCDKAAEFAAAAITALTTK